MSTPRTASLWERAAPPGSWRIDAAVALALFALLFALRPAFPDGDGSTYAAQAMSRPLFHHAGTKHVFYEAALRLVYLACEALGLRAYALVAFTLVSNLAGTALYLILARGLYPPLLGGAGLSRLCALGALASFGVMASAATIETYASSLALAAATVAMGMRGGFASAGRGACVGLLFVLAVGFHVLNVLLLPLLLALAAHGVRRNSWRPFAACAAVIALGLVVVPAGPYLNRAAGAGLLELIPSGDPQPPLSLLSRLLRAAYGVLRTAAWLPPFWELTVLYAAGYAAAAATSLALVAFVARRAWRRAGPPPSWLWAGVLLLAVPVAALGVGYYPSDPERWLHLVPAAWLLIGFVWDAAGANRLPLAALVLILGIFNAGYKLAPETRHHPDLPGLRALDAFVQPGDLVVAPSRFDLMNEFMIGRPFRGEVLPLDRQIEAYKNDPEGCERELDRRLNDALRQGRKVYVFALLGEGLDSGRGYPWAFAAAWGYSPQQFEQLLRQYRAQPIFEPTPRRRGIYRLEGR
jgi:hypothetical protein